MNLQILATEREKYFRAVKRLFARSLESTELLHLSVVCVWWGWLNWPWPVLDMAVSPISHNLRLDTDADGGITATEFEVPSQPLSTSWHGSNRIIRRFFFVANLVDTSTKATGHVIRTSKTLEVLPAKAKKPVQLSVCFFARECFCASVQVALQDKTLISVFDALEISVEDAWNLFRTLDSDPWQRHGRICISKM